MKNFFQPGNRYTEVLTENGEIWAYGSSYENIDSETPRVYISNDSSLWGDGLEKKGLVPITDGNGIEEWVLAWIYEGDSCETPGTDIEKRIIECGYKFNAELD